MIVNLQRKVRIKSAAFMPLIVTLRAAVEETQGGNFSVALVSDKRMKELNKFFRGKDSTTDVLSFPHEPDEFYSRTHAFTREDADSLTPEGVTLGDIVISAEQAERQAKENGLSLENEIKQLILHGVLHLCGYDHETDNGEMNARELELRDRLGIN
jgi:probable rRNA maturation factor